jgi:tetratricopeptide (TPR) repeat protein
MTKQIPESLNTEYPGQKFSLRKFLCEMQAKIEKEIESSESYTDLACLKNVLIDFIKASPLDDRAKDYLTFLALKTDPDRFKEEWPSVEILYKRLKKYNKSLDSHQLEAEKQIRTKRKVIRAVVGAGIITAIALLSKCACDSCKPGKGEGVNASQEISQLEIPDTPDLENTPSKQIPKSFKKELEQPSSTTSASPGDSASGGEKAPKEVEAKEKAKREIQKLATYCGTGPEHAANYFGVDAESKGQLNGIKSRLELNAERFPNDYVLNYQLGIVYLALREDQAAFNQFYKIQTIYNDENSYNQLVSLMLTSSGQREKAKEWLVKGLRKWPKDSCLMHNFGSYYLKKGDYQNAEKYFLDTIQLSSSNSKKAALYANLGLMAAIQGDYKSSKSYIKRALRLDPNMGLAPQSALEVRAMAYEIQAIEAGDDVKFVNPIH